MDAHQPHPNGAANQNGDSSLVKVPSHQSDSLRPQPVHPALSPKLTALGILNALKKRWLPAAVVGILCAVPVAAGVWVFSPAPKLNAQMVLHVSAGRQWLVPSKSGEKPLDLYKRYQMALIKSNHTLNKVLNDPNVKKLSMVKKALYEQIDSVQWLKELVKVDSAMGPEFIRISMEGDDPGELKVLLKAVADTYFEILEKEKKEYQDRIGNLETLVNNYQEKIDNKNSTLQKIVNAKKPALSRTMQIEQEIALIELGAAKQKLAELKSELRKLDVEIQIKLAPQMAYMSDHSIVFSAISASATPLRLCCLAHIVRKSAAERKQSSAQELHPIVKKYLDQSPELASISNRILELKQKKEAEVRIWTNIANPNWTNWNRYNAEWKKLNAKAAERKKELRKKYTDELSLQIDLESKVGVIALRQQKYALEKLKNRLKADVDMLDTESATLEKEAVDLQEIHNALERYKKMRDRFEGEAEIMKINDIVPPRVSKMDDEAVIVRNQSNRHIMMAGAAGAGTLGFVLFLFGWLEFRFRRINSPDEVLHGLGIQLVGTLPDHSARPLFRMPMGRRASKRYDRNLVDSIDAIRTMILFADKAEGINVIMVTSAVGGEGKTTSASHLAASLSRTERNTLLIDCDLRKSSVHHLFDMPLSPGLSELLRGECDIAYALFQTSVPNLTVLTAGKADAKAFQALSKKTIAAIFSKLREQFEFIVIDSPPVLPVADSLLLAQQADAVIFSILRDVSRFPTVYSAYQRLTNLGARILGAVVSGTRDEVYSSHYDNPS